MHAIKKLILEGEGVSLDFKNRITRCDKIAKTMVAFANNIGGQLLVGVADDGSIKGVKFEEEEKFMINKAASQYTRPIIEPKFEEVYIDDKLVLIVNIDASDTKPHYALGDDGKWWVYVRVKDKSVLASKIVVEVLKQQDNSQGVLIEYSANEKALLEYLHQHERIDIAQFCQLLTISRRKAQRILVNLALSGVITIHTSEKEEYYTAA